MKYEAKLKNMSEILSQLSTDKLPLGPTIIGMSEVKTERVLEDLLKQPALSDRGYEIVHYEGPDRRGVDCAIFLQSEILSPHCQQTRSNIFMRIMILPIKPVVSLLPAVHLPVKRCTLS